MIRSDALIVWAPRVLSILRIMAALLFLEHGTTKLLGFPPGTQPAMFTLSWFQGVIELVGGVLLASLSLHRADGLAVGVRRDDTARAVDRDDLTRREPGNAGCADHSGNAQFARHDRVM